MYLVLLHYIQGFQGQEIENDRIGSAGKPCRLVFAVSLLIGSDSSIVALRLLLILLNWHHSIVSTRASAVDRKTVGFEN